MKTVLFSIIVSIILMSCGNIGFEAGSINRKAIPAPFEDLVINPQKYDGMVIRTFCFVAEHDESTYLVGSKDLVKFYNPLSMIYADFSNLQEAMVQQNIGQLTGVYVLVEGKFSVQFADEKFIGTAFRALDLSRIQIWDEGWFERIRSEKTSQNTEEPKNYTP